MAITPRNLNIRGLSSDHTLVPRLESTRSHFFDRNAAGVHLEIDHGGQAAVAIVGPWRDTVEGQDVVIEASAEQRGTLTIEESDEQSPTEAAASHVLGIVDHDVQGARVKVTSRKYRVSFTPSYPLDRVHIETQSRA